MTTAGDQPTHILWVDDDQHVLSALRRSLRKESERWEMTFVDSPEDALSVLDAFPIDLLVSDIRMPERDGMSLLTEAKERCPNLEVILMTGLPDIDAAIEAIKSGAAYYLTKPIEHDKLIAVVEEALKDRKRPQVGGQACALFQARSQRIIGGYRIVRPIAEGNMGIVFLARKELEQQPQQFALKLLKLPTLDGGKGEDARRRFEAEAEIAFSMDHPNLVTLHEYGFAMQDRIPYMVMDYFPGQTLDQWIVERPMINQEQCIQILIQVASALTEVHKHVLCHRDLKAENVLISDDGLVKLIDFGVAKIVESELTQIGSVLGTPSYLAPEWLQNSPGVDHRADLFSLGVLAYELSVGVSPFEAESLPTLVRQIVNDEPTPPRTLEPTVPPGLADIILRLLAKNPDDRYPDAAVVTAKLQDLLTELTDEQAKGMAADRQMGNL